MTMIAPAALVLVNQTLQGFFPEIASPQGLGTEEDISHVIFEVGAEPEPHGDAKSVLLATDNFAGNHALESFLQNVLGGELAKFQVRRNVGCELQKFVVEKRTAHLQGVGHTHSVRLDQQVAGQVRFGVDIKQLADGIYIIDVLKVTLETY